jgi:hypothetical protein
MSFLFNEPATEAGLLNKSSRLAPALGAAKFITIIAMYFGHTLLCFLSPT